MLHPSTGNPLCRERPSCSARVADSNISIDSSLLWHVAARITRLVNETYQEARVLLTNHATGQHRVVLWYSSASTHSSVRLTVRVHAPNLKFESSVVVTTLCAKIWKVWRCSAWLNLFRVYFHSFIRLFICVSSYADNKLINYSISKIMQLFSHMLLTDWVSVLTQRQSVMDRQTDRRTNGGRSQTENEIPISLYVRHSFVWGRLMITLA